ncbi:MAG: sulfite exporter TauE/SafE family protein [Nitrosomonadales bacterium]
MHLALGTAMAAILFTSIASLLKHHQHGAVNWRIVRDITPEFCSERLWVRWSLLLYRSAVWEYSLRCSCYFPQHKFFWMCARTLHGSSRALSAMSVVGTITGWISSMVSIGGGALYCSFSALV